MKTVSRKTLNQKTFLNNLSKQNFSYGKRQILALFCRDDLNRDS